ncbi:MAG: hypothetical protein AAF414_20900 [Pseudomonadota bacterium]
MSDRHENTADGLAWPKDYKELRALIHEQWGVGEIYLTRQLSGGKSGALVYLADVTSSDFTGLAILKFDKHGDPAQQERTEAERHLNAYESSPVFAKGHLPRVLNKVHNDTSIAILSTVAGRGLEYARPWEQCNHVEQVNVAKRLSCSLLEDWNSNVKMARGLTSPQSVLRSWLGHKLDAADQRLHTTVAQVCGIPPEEPSFVFDGQWYPNPLAFALWKPEDFEQFKLRAIEGHIHGDLNGLNIVVNQVGEERSQYYLIDLAYYQDRQFLFFDHAYLALSHLLYRRGHVTVSHWTSIVTQLCPFDHLRQSARFDGDDLGLINLLKDIRTEVFDWVDRHQAHRLSYMESQFQLAQVAAGLNFASKRISPELRRFGFMYAAIILKDYLRLHDIKWTKHGPPLSTDDTARIAGSRQPPNLTESHVGRSDVESPPLPENPAIAVLPFDDLSRDGQQEFFTDGVTDELITELSRVDWLMVISRGSTFEYKGRTANPKQIGRELGVHFVVEGSVLRAGPRMRINAKLVDAQDGSQVWADRFERQTDDLFELQREIATAIAGQIDSHVRSTEQKQAKLKSGNITLWESFQRAMWHFHKFTEEDSEMALEQLAKLANKEATISGIPAALALLQMRRLMMGDVDDVDAVLKDALNHAIRAVELDARSSFARTALSRVYSMQGKYDQALEEAELSLEFNPSFALGYLNLASALMWGGHAEDAVPALEKSIRLSPRGPMLRVKMIANASIYYFLNDYGQAERLFARVQSNRNLAPFAQLMLAATHVRQDRIEEARSAFAATIEARPNFSLSTFSRSWRTLASNYRSKLFEDLTQAGLPP